MSDRHIRILAFAGSLRSASYNRMLLRAAQEVAPEQADIDVFDLAALPFYNYDTEKQGDPESVASFKQRIADADAILIATPEYQHGVPGVLKNALDWASRPPSESVLNGMPVAIMGASPGMTATARAQTQLRQTLTYNSTDAVAKPEVLVGRAHERFDDAGRLTDETAISLVRELLKNLVALTLRG